MTNDQRCCLHQTETRSQINSSYFRIAAQLFRRSVAENSAFVNDVRPVGHRKRISHIVVRNQHPYTGCPHVADYFLQIENRDRVNSRKRLIQQNELGLNAQRPRNLNPSSFATGQCITPIQANMLQPELINQLLHGLAPLVPGDRLGFQHGENVLLNRELSENRRLLGEIADPKLPRPFVHGDVGDLFLIYEDSARVGGYQADDRVKGRGLAGAVRSKQSNDFALTYAHADAVYNPAAAVRLTYIFGGQRLHLTYHSGLGDGGQTAITFNDDPIIGPKQSQRNPGNLAMFGIKNARRSTG
jgi:hypothetical protein